MTSGQASNPAANRAPAIAGLAAAARLRGTDVTLAAAASVTSAPRSLAAALSPALAGALFAAGFEAWPLVICGALKILYDVALLWTFRHVRPPEEQ